MKKGNGDADNSFGPPLGQRPVWSTDGPDYECDCPGPPPRFYLPPPPRPASLPSNECLDNSDFPLETCKAVPVIDSEYRHSTVIPSVTIILIATVSVMVFLFIGTFLVLIKKRKTPNLFPRKSLRDPCDGASANGVVYEDLTNIGPRTLSPGCPQGQTTLPSIEMIDVASYADHPALTPVLICPTSSVVETYSCQDLFNPVYEELSNGSGERAESNSEGMLQIAASEDEFAEDELSLGGESDDRLGRNGKRGEQILRETVESDAGRDVDSSDADDRSKFLEKHDKNYREKDKRTVRLHGVTWKAKTVDKRKVWRNKTLPPLPAPSAHSSELNEGFLLRRILQIYPDVTGMAIQYPRGSPVMQFPDYFSSNSADYESLPNFGSACSHQSKPDIFSVKSHNQDSALGSDSGYSNNTSGGRSLPATRASCGVPSSGNTVLS